MVAKQHESLPALVIAAHGRRGHLQCTDGKTRRYMVKGRKMRVVCGDRVCWSPQSDGAVVLVTEICPRENTLSRPSPRDGKAEILAANLTQVAVVIAPVPEPDLFIVDRYLCAAELMGCESILVLNKSDMEATRNGYAEDYAAIGYATIEVSAKTADGLDNLANKMNDQITILVGQSGVGKSSLINALIPDSSAAVGELSTATSEGTHTTTASIMHTLPCGNRLIDTPGIRDFIPHIDDARHVQEGFREIFDVVGGCRFANCQHLREPDCAVKQAVESGDVAARRYESYKRLLRSVTNDA